MIYFDFLIVNINIHSLFNKHQIVRININFITTFWRPHLLK